MGYLYTRPIQKHIRSAFSQKKLIKYDDILNYCQNNFSEPFAFHGINSASKQDVQSEKYHYIELSVHTILSNYLRAGFIYPVRWRENLEYCLKEVEDYIEEQINEKNNDKIRALNRSYTEKEMADILPDILVQATCRSGTFEFGMDSFSICNSENPCILFQAIYLTLKGRKTSTPPWINSKNKKSKKAYYQVCIEATTNWSLPDEEPYLEVKWKAHDSLFSSRYFHGEDL